MRIVKPRSLGLLTRPFESHGRRRLGVAALALFDLEGALAPEVDLWALVAAELAGAPVDAAIPKARGEYLVSGSAHVPGGEPAPTCRVDVRVGDLDKTLYVVGDREFRDGVQTAPIPFSRMPLEWARAFGGPGYPKNPLGRGFAPVERQGRRVHPLPNLELPGRLVETPRDTPDPAGLGPLDITWPQRARLAGTYDERWRDERFPAFADDLDWGIFNLAPRDQQRDGFWRGDEAFTLRHLHPSRPVVEGRLPGLSARCFVRLSGQELAPLPTRLTTVWLFPHRERCVVVFHGSTEIAEDDAADVEVLVAGLEHLEGPKPAPHYAAVLARRLDATSPTASLLDESRLLPEGLGAPSAAAPIAAARGLLAQNLARGAERRRAQTRARVAALGGEPAAGASVQPPEELELEPPTISGGAPTAPPGDDSRAADLRATALSRRASGQSLRAMDLGGADLSGLDLQGADLRDANLEGAFLRAVDLRGADLGRARLSGADLTAAKLSGATAIDAFFGGARMIRVEADGADLGGAVLSRANLSGASLRGARLSGADLSEATFEATDLSEVDAAGVVFLKSDLRGASFGKARLGKCHFLEVDVRGVDFAAARLESAVFVSAMGDGASFYRAWLTNLRVVQDSSFRQASFQGAVLDRANLRGTRLAQADLSGAQLLGADLGGCELRAANLYRAVARGAQLVRADLTGAVMASIDLMHGSLDKADLRGADLRGANLFGADLARVRTDERTDMAGADRARARVVPRRPQP